LYAISTRRFMMIISAARTIVVPMMIG
jgi:hypothetical protein